MSVLFGFATPPFIVETFAVSVIVAGRRVRRYDADTGLLLLLLISFKKNFVSLSSIGKSLAIKFFIKFTVYVAFPVKILLPVIPSAVIVALFAKSVPPAFKTKLASVEAVKQSGNVPFKSFAVITGIVADAFKNWQIFSGTE